MSTKFLEPQTGSYRWVAHVHNVARYNKLALVEIIDSELHKRLGEGTAEVRVYSYVGITVLAVGLFPTAYVNATNNQGDMAPRLADPVTGTFIGLSFAIFTILMSCLIQYCYGPWGLDFVEQDQSGASYGRKFKVYKYVFKLWQSYVILPYAPGLTYNNYCLWKKRGHPHVGVFVVGLAVNIVQMVILEFLLLSFVAIYGIASEAYMFPDKRSGLLHQVGSEVGIAFGVCYVVVRFALGFMNLLLGQSSQKIAEIDLVINQVAQRAFKDQFIFQHMMAHSSCELIREDFDKLSAMEPGEHKGKTSPSATSVMELSILEVMESDGRIRTTRTSYDVATGQEIDTNAQRSAGCCLV